jgi:hypothetical protein
MHFVRRFGNAGVELRANFLGERRTTDHQAYLSIQIGRALIEVENDPTKTRVSINCERLRVQGLKKSCRRISASRSGLSVAAERLSS